MQNHMRNALKVTEKSYLKFRMKAFGSLWDRQITFQLRQIHAQLLRKHSPTMAH